MSTDDLYEDFMVPQFQHNLMQENESTEDLDEFFPELPEVDEVTVQMEAITINENPEDLGRMAMFGKKQQVKRRSQIQREQEIASIPQQKTEAKPSRPVSLTRDQRVKQVKQSPRPVIAFGSVKPKEPRTSVIRSRDATPRKEKIPPLRNYPTPSGKTPLRPLTVPETPQVVKKLPPSRPVSMSTHQMRTRSQSTSRQTIEKKPPAEKKPIVVQPSPRSRCEKKDIQAIVDRLSKPKTPQPVFQTPARKIPNTYTHGLKSATKEAPRFRKPG